VLAGWPRSPLLIADCAHQNHVLRVRLDKARALPEFVPAVVNSEIGQAYFRSMAKRITNLASINSKEVAALPLAPLDVQRDLANALEAARARAADIRRDATALRDKAAADFEAAVYGEATPAPAGAGRTGLAARPAWRHVQAE
jgi:type I restriction enzyme S subunit